MLRLHFWGHTAVCAHCNCSPEQANNKGQHLGKTKCLEQKAKSLTLVSDHQVMLSNSKSYAKCVWHFYVYQFMLQNNTANLFNNLKKKKTQQNTNTNATYLNSYPFLATQIYLTVMLYSSSLQVKVVPCCFNFLAHFCLYFVSWRCIV